MYRTRHDICYYISMLFWSHWGHMTPCIFDASSQLGDASAQLRDASNFTLKYSSIFRRSVISTWRRVRSTPRRVKNAIMTPMAYHIARHSIVLISIVIQTFLQVAKSSDQSGIIQILSYLIEYILILYATVYILY